MNRRFQMLSGKVSGRGEVLPDEKILELLGARHPGSEQHGSKTEGGPAEPQAITEAQPRDPLTGLPPRAVLEDRVDEWTRIQSRYRAPFALVLIKAGSQEPTVDDVLREVADAIASTVREADTLARVAQNEFGLVLPNQDADHAFELGVRLARSVGQVPAAGKRVPIYIGIASAPKHAETPDGLWQAVTRALERASDEPERIALATEPRFRKLSGEVRPLGNEVEDDPTDRGRT